MLAGLWTSVALVVGVLGSEKASSKFNPNIGHSCLHHGLICRVSQIQYTLTNTCMVPSCKFVSAIVHVEVHSQDADERNIE